jgi:hypothetical protein
MSIKIKPVLCGKGKCKSFHYIFAYSRERGSDGKIHEKYLGKVVGFKKGRTISNFDKVSILPPKDKKSTGPGRGVRNAAAAAARREPVEIMVGRSFRRIFAKLGPDDDE